MAKTELTISIEVDEETRAELERVPAERLSSAVARAVSAACEPEETGRAAAVLRRAFVMKADDGDDDEAEEERYVLGVAMEPDEVDTQGDTQDAETIREACFEWMESYRAGGDAGHMGLMHEQIVDGKVVVLENYIQKGDAVVGGQIVKDGSWMMGLRIVDPKLWEAVKAGDLTGLSIGGTAIAEPLDGSET